MIVLTDKLIQLVILEGACSGCILDAGDVSSPFPEHHIPWFLYGKILYSREFFMI